MIKHSVKRYDADSYQIFLNGQLVAIAISYGNAGWRAHDLSDKRLSQYGSHPTPKALAKAMDAQAAA